jgi:hypothetical protein
MMLMAKVFAFNDNTTPVFRLYAVRGRVWPGDRSLELQQRARGEDGADPLPGSAALEA